jgi:hypothetical protein
MRRDTNVGEEKRRNDMRRYGMKRHLVLAAVYLALMTAASASSQSPISDLSGFDALENGEWHGDLAPTQAMREEVVKNLDVLLSQRTDLAGGGVSREVLSQDVVRNLNQLTASLDGAPAPADLWNIEQKEYRDFVYTSIKNLDSLAGMDGIPRSFEALIPREDFFAPPLIPFDISGYL